MKDRNGKKIHVGDAVVWYDPEEEYRDTTRIYHVYKLYAGIVFIEDEYSQGEVFPSEIEIIPSMNT